MENAVPGTFFRDAVNGDAGIDQLQSGNAVPGTSFHVILGPKAPRMPPVEEWTKRLEVAQKRIHARTRAGCRLGRTTVELDNALPRAEAIVDRFVFYAAAKEAMAAARQAHEKPRAARNAERHALIRVLLNFGLVRVRVGGVLLSSANSEVLL